MPTLPKELVADAYRRLVEARGGKVISQTAFERKTGISPYYWRGGYWRSWSVFQAALGYSPNRRPAKIPDTVLLRRYAELALEKKKLPTQAELRLKRKQDASFPDSGVFSRLGRRDELLAKLAAYGEGKGEFAPVVELVRQSRALTLGGRRDSPHVAGIVYLLRSGKNYKIGRTNASGRRLRALATRLAHQPDTVHAIDTDDPEGIERYWRTRFRDKRVGRKLFALSADDISAFKSRRFQ